MTTIAPATAQVSRPAAGTLRTILPTLARDVAVPTGAYYLLHALGATDVVALLAGAVTSGAILIAEAVRARKLDVFSGFMLGVFAVGLVTSLVSGDPRFMVAKESFGTLLVGAAFALSALVGKPLIYLAARRMQADPAAFEAKFAATPAMRATMTRLSVIWGAGLLTEGVLRLVLAYRLPIATMVWLSTAMMIATFAGLIAVTMRIRANATR
jgi:intracellular septation protein A